MEKKKVNNTVIMSRKFNMYFYKSAKKEKNIKVNNKKGVPEGNHICLETKGEVLNQIFICNNTSTWNDCITG